MGTPWAYSVQESLWIVNFATLNAGGGGRTGFVAGMACCPVNRAVTMSAAGVAENKVNGLMIQGLWLRNRGV